MSDPLSDLIRLLHPRAVFANPISGKGAWAVRFSEFGQPSFCIMLQGSCRLSVDGHAPVRLDAGDFVLLPTTPAFTIASEAPAPPVHLDPARLAATRGEVRYGEQGGAPEMRSLGGSFLFEASDPALLVSLLPGLVHVPGAERLAQLVKLVGEESAQEKPGSAVMLSRLVDLLLIEALRANTGTRAPPGLLRGLGDERLAAALTQMHARIDHPWTISQLAGAAALSRSSFFERFTQQVGAAPMEYLLSWRMTVARNLLRREQLSVAEVAERVGYGSSSTFSVAFSRHVGVPPSRYASAG
ncbi:AraC family transcriptional regulator [Tahibacter harae]|uniref:AraC family transcriptional regulator n=1 Tax=Tahibacter harae TaxID=2963937 RepID=A0ABT1QWA5_9GAMM|nr:AraC family transcriptional regulator [Tahibacter harae]MCQ4166572.1 AraC family transcriptional regulator [Tahibacter harae]